MQTEDHGSIEGTVVLEHRHSYVHKHKVEGAGGDEWVHFHNPSEPHTHEFLIRPTDAGYEIIHPQMEPA